MRYNSPMTVQTIPAIKDMTARQQAELLEALWQAMKERVEKAAPPTWHLRLLEEREIALAEGKDEFIDLEVAMAEIRESIEARKNSR